MNTFEFILNEGVLNDNTLILPKKGYHFKGGYIGKVVEYTFRNAWQNDKHIKNFRSAKRLHEYLNKHYPQTEYEYDFSGTTLDN